MERVPHNGETPTPDVSFFCVLLSMQTLVSSEPSIRHDLCSVGALKRDPLLVAVPGGVWCDRFGEDYRKRHLENHSHENVASSTRM